MLNIRTDIDRAERMLSDLGRQQLPFATALAINDAAGEVKEAEERSIASSFDRPTPFTQRGLYLRRASKSKLTARVGVKRIQSEYLGRNVTGGQRRPKGRALVVPVGMRLNAYGNMPKNAVRRALSRSKVFSASDRSGKSKHLPGGVYERRGRGGKKLKLLVAYEPAASYTPRWQFDALALRTARRAFRPAFIRRMQQAIASAK